MTTLEYIKPHLEHTLNPDDLGFYDNKLTQLELGQIASQYQRGWTTSHVFETFPGFNPSDPPVSNYSHLKIMNWFIDETASDASYFDFSPKWKWIPVQPGFREKSAPHMMKAVQVHLEYISRISTGQHVKAYATVNFLKNLGEYMIGSLDNHPPDVDTLCRNQATYVPSELSMVYRNVCKVYTELKSNLDPRLWARDTSLLNIRKFDHLAMMREGKHFRHKFVEDRRHLNGIRCVRHILTNPGDFSSYFCTVDPMTHEQRCQLGFSIYEHFDGFASTEDVIKYGLRLIDRVIDNYGFFGNRITTVKPNPEVLNGVIHQIRSKLRYNPRAGFPSFEDGSYGMEYQAILAKRQWDAYYRGRPVPTDPIEAYRNHVEILKKSVEFIVEASDTGISLREALIREFNSLDNPSTLEKTIRTLLGPPTSRNPKMKMYQDKHLNSRYNLWAKSIIDPLIAGGDDMTGGAYFNISPINVDESNVPGTCMDVMYMESDRIGQYLADNPQHVVLIHLTDGPQSAIGEDQVQCIDTDTLLNYFNNPLYTVFPCRRERDQSNNVVDQIMSRDIPCVYLPVSPQGFKYHIGISDFAMMLIMIYCGYRIFYIQKVYDFPDQTISWIYTADNLSGYVLDSEKPLSASCTGDTPNYLYKLFYCGHPETCIKSVIASNFLREISELDQSRNRTS